MEIKAIAVDREAVVARVVSPLESKEKKTGETEVTA